MRRGCPTAAAQDIDESGAREFAGQLRHILRALVIEAEFIGQAGVGKGADPGVRHAADFGDVLAHLARAERAVEADRERLGVGERVPKGLRRLARQRAAREIGDCARDHDREHGPNFVEGVLERVKRRLGVQCVEDRLDQQNVGAAVDQAKRRLAVSGAQIIEAHGAKAGIGDVRRDRRRAIGRPDRPRDEALGTCLFSNLVAGRSREPRALEVELVSQIFQPVIGLGDGRRRESVGFDNVGAGFKILDMNILDRLGLRQRQQIVIAPQILGVTLEAFAAEIAFRELMALDHRAHGAVEDQDFFARQPVESLENLGAMVFIESHAVAFPCGFSGAETRVLAARGQRRGSAPTRQSSSTTVMAGLVPAIHARTLQSGAVLASTSSRQIIV